MSQHHEPKVVPTETKDWTLVLDSGCGQCGWQPFDPQASEQRFVEAAARWGQVLQRDTAGERPSELVWSPIEYAYHVREILDLLPGRLRAMLTQADPEFQNYDGDASAVQNRTWAAEPSAVARDIALATERVVETLASVQDTGWQRTGHRSDGVGFTVGSLCQYMVHDVEHHLWDVNG